MSPLCVYTCITQLHYSLLTDVSMPETRIEFILLFSTLKVDISSMRISAELGVFSVNLRVFC